jgi:gamma-glutamylcyclotransferase (GGCT)/AIG2-like uncharacterized protein YtfP
MTSNRSAVFAQEFASYATVISSFREVVQYIHADLCSRGFHVGFRCGKPFRSEIDWYTSEGPIVFIYPYSGTQEHPLNPLWDLIHEWGHSIDDPPPRGYKCDPGPESLQRETRAWNSGWRSAVGRFQSLSRQEEDFQQRQEECLDTYRFPSAMRLVFQYGSNADSQRLNASDRLRGDARQIGIAYTEDDYELDFTVWSDGNHCAAADIVPGSGRKIWGVLYEVPDYLITRETARNRNRKSLDEIEGEGTNYCRTTITLRDPNGSPINAQVITYVVIEKRMGLQTSLEYACHIITGLREHGAPNDYINYVKARIVANNPSLRDDIAAR